MGRGGAPLGKGDGGFRKRSLHSCVLSVASAAKRRAIEDGTSQFVDDNLLPTLQLCWTMFQFGLDVSADQQELPRLQVITR